MAVGVDTRRNRPAPLSIVDVLRGVVQIYRRGFVAFIIVTGILSVPDAVVSTGFELATRHAGPEDQGTIAVSLDVLSFFWSTLTLALSVLVEGATIHLAATVILGQPVQFLESYRVALRRFVPLVLAAVLIMLPLSVLVAIVVIPAVIAAGGGVLSSPTLLLVTFAFGVVGVLGCVLIGWVLAFQIILLEGAGSLAAVRRSWGMVRWHRWRLFVCMLAITMLELLLYNAPSCLVPFAYGVEVWPNTCWGNEPAPTPLFVMDAVLRALSNTLFHALLAITVTLLYYDLRVADEGLDLDLRAALRGSTPS